MKLAEKFGLTPPFSGSQMSQMNTNEGSIFLGETPDPKKWFILSWR